MTRGTRKEPPPSDPEAGIWQGQSVARRFVSPDGMTVLNAEALKASDVEPAPEAGDVLELGVTVAAGAPHALSTSAVPNAPVARARATDG